jgi:hypothetical protein
MALDTIARQAGLSLSFSPDIVNLEMPVTLEAKNLTVAAALTEVLIDMHLDVVLSPSGQLSLVRQPAPPAVGIVTGRVTDSTVNEGITRFTESLPGVRRSPHESSVTARAPGQRRSRITAPPTWTSHSCKRQRL